MGKIIVSENVSLDGGIQDPTGSEGTSFGGWFARTTGKDREAWAKVEFEEALGTDAMLMGRRSYEWFVALGWASRDGEWADRLRTVPKHVVSSTLTDLPWANSTVLTGDVLIEVAALKDRVAGDIVVHGSGRLVHTLLAHDLVEELRLMVFPFVAGGGDRMFGTISEQRSLLLTDTRTIGDGIVALTYQPA
jgi:dihydrofolate reductase